MLTVTWEIPSEEHLLKSGADMGRQLIADLSGGEERLVLVRWNPEKHVPQNIALLLRTESLYDEITGNLRKLYEALQVLRTTKSLAIFCGSGHCHGVIWDVALSCHVRIWTSYEGTVGFPGGAMGAVPPLLADPRAKGAARAPWDNSPVLTVADANAKGLIDGVIPLERVVDWAKTLSKEHAGRLLTRSKGNPSVPVWHDRGQVQAYAKRILDETHQSWLSRLIPARLEPQSTSDGTSIFGLNVDQSIPPAHLLYSLRDEPGYKVVFYAETAERLAGALTLIHGRIQRLLTAETFHRIWAERVFWCVGTPQIATALIDLEFRIDETFTITTQDGLVEALALPQEMNSLEAPLVEIAAKTDPAMERHIHIISREFLTSPSFDGLTMTMFARLMTLIEITRVALKGEGKVGAVVDALRKAGWTVCGNDIFWQRFIQHPHVVAHPEWKKLEKELGGDIIPSWGDLVQRVQRRGRAKNQVNWGAIETSNHFMMHTQWLLTRLIEKRVVDRTPAQLSTWLAHGLGMAPVAGSSQIFAAKWGPRRSSYYLKTHFEGHVTDHLKGPVL